MSKTLYLRRARFSASLVNIAVCNGKHINFFPMNIKSSHRLFIPVNNEISF